MFQFSKMFRTKRTFGALDSLEMFAQWSKWPIKEKMKKEECKKRKCPFERSPGAKFASVSNTHTHTHHRQKVMRVHFRFDSLRRTKSTADSVDANACNVKANKWKYRTHNARRVFVWLLCMVRGLSHWACVHAWVVGYGFQKSAYVYIDSMLEMCKISYDILTPNVCKTRSTNVSHAHSSLLIFPSVSVALIWIKWWRSSYVRLFHPCTVRVRNGERKNPHTLFFSVLWLFWCCKKPIYLSMYIVHSLLNKTRALMYSIVHKCIVCWALCEEGEEIE